MPHIEGCDRDQAQLPAHDHPPAGLVNRGYGSAEIERGAMSAAFG
jgi:hypothetical protein